MREQYEHSLFDTGVVYDTYLRDNACGCDRYVFLRNFTAGFVVVVVVVAFVLLIRYVSFASVIIHATC